MLLERYLWMMRIKLPQLKSTWFFFQNVGLVFDKLVKRLEETQLCIPDVYEEIRKFIEKMQQRKDDSFYRFQTRQLMDKLHPAEKAKVKVDFTKFYTTVISYIGKWFDLSTNNVMMTLRPIGLFEKLKFSDLEEVAAVIKLTDTLNMEKLYEEFCASQEAIERARQDPQKSTSEKWVSVFHEVGKVNLTNLFQIVSFVLSVPGSNAFVERIFSHMAKQVVRCKKSLQHKPDQK